MKDYIERLKKFEDYILKLPEITGCAYLGSLGRGDIDEYSDYDIGIFVKKKNLKKVREKWKYLISLIGEIKFSYAESEEDFKAYVSDNFYKIDLEILEEHNIPYLRYKSMKIIKDTGGLLQELKEKAKKLKIPKILVSKEEFENKLLQCRDSQLYIIKHLARGWNSSAMSAVNFESNELFKLLASLKGMKDYEFIRVVEKELSDKELKMFNDTICNSLKKEEIKRAIDANWNLINYIEKMYEKMTGYKINMEELDLEIKKKIEEIYLKLEKID